MPRFSAIYRGAVMHARYRPVQHRLEHRVFAMLLDLDELEELARATRGFGHNRFNFLSFYDRDHGPGDGTPLRPWLESLVAAQGIDIRGGALRVLCYPRVLGFVFNPLSVWYCYRRDGALAAVVYEVHNTFGERHAYVFRLRAAKMRRSSSGQPKPFTSPRSSAWTATTASASCRPATLFPSPSANGKGPTKPSSQRSPGAVQRSPPRRCGPHGQRTRS